MELKWVYCCPVLIRYTDVKGPKNAMLWSFLCFMYVRIEPEYEHDIGLYEHELEHCKQNVRSLFLHPLLYIFCKRYRLWCEVKAYALQVNVYVYASETERIQMINLFSTYISEWYKLNITFLEARTALRDELDEY